MSGTYGIGIDRIILVYISAEECVFHIRMSQIPPRACETPCGKGVSVRTFPY